MRAGASRLYLITAVILTAAVQPLAAQQGAIAGRVTNTTTLDPAPAAHISIVGGGPLATASSRRDGSFELRLAAGTYDPLMEAADLRALGLESLYDAGAE